MPLTAWIKPSTNHGGVEVIKRSILSLVLPLVLVLTACGGQPAAPAPSAPAPSAPAPAPAALKVAMLLPGKVNDQSWNAAGNAALQEVKKQVGAEISYVEDVNPANQNEVWRDYAAKGYNLILSWGGQFEDGAKAVSGEFPKTAFVVIDGVGENGKNYASFDMATEQYHFLGGALASAVSKSHVVGAIGGLCFANTARAINGYVQGAQFVDPKVKVQKVYTGDFEDPAKAKAAALSMISQGADVLMTNLNAGLQGVVEAAKEKNVLVIAEWADLNQLAPKNMLSAVLMDQSVLAVKSAQAVKDGSFKGKRFVQTIQLGDQLNLAAFHDLAAQSVRDQIAALQKDLASGKVQVKSDEGCN